MTYESTFSDDAWAATERLRAAIDDLPFLRQLETGDLPETAFLAYLAQDALYLVEYARALALAASQAPTADQIAFWAGGARNCVLVEHSLHEARLAAAAETPLPVVPPSPVCVAYTSFLQALATRGSYPVLVAGVLPCYWIYDDVGSRLLARLGDRIEGHPYAEWIATYADPSFAESCLRARAIANLAADSSSPDVVAAMHRAFEQATRYEWMFWDAPLRDAAWPV